MKWLTHQTTTVAAALALAMPAAAVGAAWAGSVLPDLLDQKRAALSRNRQRTFNRIHRGTSHWFGWWLALFVLPLAATSPLAGYPQSAAVVGGLGFGALCHVAQDMLTTTGVPLLPWSRRGRVALGLCRTGGAGEYVFLAVALACCGLVVRQRFF